MTSDPAVQWTLTVLFAASSIYSLWRLAGCRHVFTGLGHTLHLGMNLGMVAMAWPWWSRLPVVPQLVFFAAAAVFFASAAGWHAVDGLPSGEPVQQRWAGHHQDASVQAVHAVMMLAMVWAVAVMSPVQGAAHHLDHGAHAARLGAGAAVGGAVLVGALVAGAGVFLVQLVRHRRGHGAAWGRVETDHLAGASTSLGMAAMCGLMLTG